MSGKVVPQDSTSLVLNSFNGRLDLEKTPIPIPTPPGSVVVRVLSTPVRPHQRAGFHGKSPLSFTPPYNPGDGGVGRIVSVGPDAVALKPGQLVYMNNFVIARDDPNTRVLLGIHDGGGPERDIKLFDFWQGFWRDVIALSRSVSKLEPLTSRFPRVTALEVSGDEKKDAEAIRNLAPDGVDAYIDVSPPAATSSHQHFNVSINSLRSFGRVVFLGMMFDVKLNYASLMVRNITIKAQFMYTREELVSLIKMIEAGVLKLGKEAGHQIVGRGFCLDEWEKAVTIAETAMAWGQQVLLYPSADVS